MAETTIAPGIKTLDTCLVKHKATGKTMRINKAGFNAEVHERARERVQANTDVEAENKYTEDALMELSIGALRKLPEWKRIKNRRELRNKADMVAAILNLAP